MSTTTNAIVPLNIAALRVNASDSSNMTGQFAGNSATYDNIPFQVNTKPSGYSPQTFIKTSPAFTSDAVHWDLNDNAYRNLQPGVHLHWELPDHFRRGHISSEGSDVRFPQVPNRWMVVRYFSLFDAGKWSDVTSQVFIVESDYIFDPTPSGTNYQDYDNYILKAKQPDYFPSSLVSVPLAFQTKVPTQPITEYPYKYMGKVFKYSDWNPTKTNPTSTPTKYIGNFNDPDGDPYYLTAVGFAGPTFSAYYPECKSVFGFYDSFSDLQNVGGQNIYMAIKYKGPIKFKVSYQVIGWVDDASKDPLATAIFPNPNGGADVDFGTLVQDTYNNRATTIFTNGVKTAPKVTPADVFVKLAEQNFNWSFNAVDIPFTLNTAPGQAQTIQTISLPTRSLCNGIMQEIVWNSPSTLSNNEYFLSDSLSGDTQISIGNNTPEALAVLMREELNQSDTPANDTILANYEYLLDALQIGKLQKLDKNNGLFQLDEDLHSRGFEKKQAGIIWMVRSKQQDNLYDVNPSSEATVPLKIAEYLHCLNEAQKNYDQGRAKLEVMRKQIFMDWFNYITLHSSKEHPISSPPNSNSPSYKKHYNEYYKQSIAFEQALTNFIYNGGSTSAVPTCELTEVQNAETATGLLQYSYQTAAKQYISGVSTQSSHSSLAYAVTGSFSALQTAIQDDPNLVIQAVPAPPFYEPTDPVILMDSDSIQTVRRNGSCKYLPCRLSNEIISSLGVSLSSPSFSASVNAADVTGTAVPTLTNSNLTPALTTLVTDGITPLIQEGLLLMPMMAPTLAAVLSKQAGANNPAVSNLANFITTLQTGQGGPSGYKPSSPGSGLFDKVGLYCCPETVADGDCTSPSTTATANPTSTPVLVFNGTIHPYFENTSKTVNKYFTPSLSFAKAFISTKSAGHILSTPLTITLLFSNFRVTGL